MQIVKAICVDLIMFCTKGNISVDFVNEPLGMCSWEHHHCCFLPGLYKWVMVPHFTGRGAEVPRANVTCLKSQRQDLNSTLLTSGPRVLSPIGDVAHDLDRAVGVMSVSTQSMPRAVSPRQGIPNTRTRAYGKGVPWAGSPSG